MRPNLYLCLITGFLLLFQAAQAQTTIDTLRVMSYNLLNFPNGRNDCGSNVVVPARWDTLRIILDYAKPDVLLVCELQTEAGADSILNRALNVGGKTSYRRANFVLNQSDFINRNLNNMFFYDSDKIALKFQDEIITDTRDIGYYQTWVKDPGLATHQDTSFIDFYIGHFKASQTDTASRHATCQIIRNHIESFGQPRNVVLGGDFNFYTSNEGGYQVLMGGTQPLRDPINMPGTWTNNGTFAGIHTQATRSLSNPFYDCGSVGGMDDRFDFLLVADSLMYQDHDVFYIPNTYQALGNNGSTFNTRINNPINTTSVPRAVLNALFYNSDHLPVLMDLGLHLRTEPLAIQLQSWKGKATPQGNRLSWSIANPDQDPLAFFDIERSNDGTDFEFLGRVDAQNGQTNYVYWDKDAHPLQYYRLRWQDVDGRQVYSHIIAVENAHQDPLWAFYPNPMRNDLVVDLPSLQQPCEGNVRITDVWGQVVLAQHLYLEQGKNHINTTDMAQGLYVVEVSYGGYLHRAVVNKN